MSKRTHTIKDKKKNSKIRATPSERQPLVLNAAPSDVYEPEDGEASVPGSLHDSPPSYNAIVVADSRSQGNEDVLITTARTHLVQSHDTDTNQHIGRSYGALSSGDDSSCVPEESTAPLKLYKRRWYIMFIASLLAFLQGLMWNNYGPISVSLRPAMKWGDGVIALFANWGPICFLIGSIPTAWLLRKGCRISCIVGCLLIVLASVPRAFTTVLPATTYITHFSLFCNGLAGPVAMSMPATISSLWFPMSERTLATGIGSVSNYIGVAFAFMIGPYIVPNRPDPDIHVIQSELLWYMRGQAIVCVILFIAVLAYFPDKPPSSPSATAAIARVSFRKGLKDLAKCGNFWFIAWAYGISTGVFSGWGAYLLPNLRHFLPEDKAQNESGWLGFYSTIAGCFVGLVASKLADYARGYRKIILMVLCVFAVGFSLWFALICAGKLPNKTVFVYLSTILAGLCINSTIPVFYESAVEATYPIDEGTAVTTLIVFNNIGGLIFLLLPDIPHLGNQWVNWMLTGSCMFAVVMLIFYKERYHRSSVDVLHSHHHAGSNVILVASSD